MTLQSKFARLNPLCIHNVPKVTSPRPESLKDRAYDALRAAIERSELESGEPLYEVHLADQLGMSRTPVREALQLLAREGFLEQLPSRGFAVPRRSLDDLREFFELRETLEATATRYAARRATPDEIDRMAMLCERYAREPNWEKWNRIGTEFHNVIIEAARNSRLASILGSLNSQILLSRRSATGGDPQRRKQAISDHKAIYEAIKARNDERAEELAAAHVRRSYEVTLAASQSQAFASAM